jgi:hypothetical protein
MSAGARRPFLVAERDGLGEKRFFAFGADATRRMKRVADDPTDDLGDVGLGRGCPVLDGVVGRLKLCWEGWAVCESNCLDDLRPKRRNFPCFSGLEEEGAGGSNEEVWVE